MTTRSDALNLPEIIVALLVVATGGFVLWEGSAYAFGSLTRMGPGFFPVMLGIVLTGIGILLVFEVARAETPRPDLSLRPFVMVTAGMLGFAVLAERLGLIPAVVALVVLSSLAERRVRPWTIALLAAALPLAGLVLFVHGFNLPFRAFRW